MNTSQLESGFELSTHHREVLDAVECVGGDFFDGSTVPKGASLYLLAKILHDWGDDDSVKILKSMREAMGPYSTVVVIDLVRFLPARPSLVSICCAFHMQIPQSLARNLYVM